MMVNERALTAPGAAAKLFGGAERLARMHLSPAETDAAYTASGRRVCRFSLSTGMDPGRAGRVLVAAGCLSADDPRILASQEAPDLALVERMKSPDGLVAAAGEVAGSQPGRPVDRDVATRLNAIRRALSKAPDRATPDMLASAFEDVTALAAERGDGPTSAMAGRVFLAATRAGAEKTRARRERKLRNEEAR